MRRIIVYLLIVGLCLTGCTSVEPERRAYPLAVGFDLEEGRYTIHFAMADVEGSGEKGNEVLSFDGTTIKEILHDYDQTQAAYLDLGHIQTVILGENVLSDRDKISEILMYLEQEPAVGDSAAVFFSGQLQEVMKLNESEKITLGDELTGIYENRLGDRTERMVTLREVYRSWHEEQRLPDLPWVIVNGNDPEILA